MNVIFGHENALKVKDRYKLIELDTFKYKGGKVVTVFGAIEDLSMDDLVRVDELLHLHGLMMTVYGARQWPETIKFIEMLRGHWDGEFDSFYDILRERCEGYIANPPGDEWTPVIDQTVD